MSIRRTIIAAIAAILVWSAATPAPAQTPVSVGLSVDPATGRLRGSSTNLFRRNESLVREIIANPSTNDTAPTHSARNGLGGWRSVQTLAERDAIPVSRRETGMIVWVAENGLAYALDNTLTNWSTTLFPRGAKGYGLVDDTGSNAVIVLEAGTHGTTLRVEERGVIVRSNATLTLGGVPVRSLTGPGLRTNENGDLTLDLGTTNVDFVTVQPTGVRSQPAYTTSERTNLTLQASDYAATTWDVDVGGAYPWTPSGWGAAPVTLGVPSMSGSLGTNRLRWVAGTMRQSGFYTNRYYWIDDANHHPIGTFGAYATASGGSAAFGLDGSIAKFVTLICGPDESYASIPGVRLGFSNSRTTPAFSATAPFHGDLLVRWNGSTWVLTPGLGADISWNVDSYVSGWLQLSHKYCRGIGLRVSTWTADGAVSNPYAPVAQVIQNDYIVLSWIDPTSGNVVSGSASTRMTACISKYDTQGLYLDGQYGSTNLVGVDTPTQANVWTIGIFQE